MSGWNKSDREAPLMEHLTLFREQKGSLEDSMKTVTPVSDRAALLSHIRNLLKPFGVKFADEDLKVGYELYSHDERIGWDTYLVTLDGYGVVGYANGLVP